MARAKDVFEAARTAAGSIGNFAMTVNKRITAGGLTDIDILLEINRQKIFIEVKTTAAALFGSGQARQDLIDKLRKQLAEQPDQIRFALSDPVPNSPEVTMARALLQQVNPKGDVLIPKPLQKYIYVVGPDGKVVFEGRKPKLLDDLFNWSTI